MPRKEQYAHRKVARIVECAPVRDARKLIARVAIVPRTEPVCMRHVTETTTMKKTQGQQR